MSASCAPSSRARLPMPRFQAYCTLQGSTLYLPQLQRRRLSVRCATLGVELQGAHSALGDTFAAADLLAQCLALDAQTGYDAPLTATRALHAGVMTAPGRPAPPTPALVPPPPPAPAPASARPVTADASPTAILVEALGCSAGGHFRG